MPARSLQALPCPLRRSLLWLPLRAQLSVEDNELKSLAGIEPLVNLMELYAGGGALAPAHLRLHT